MSLHEIWCGMVVILVSGAVRVRWGSVRWAPLSWGERMWRQCPGLTGRLLIAREWWRAAAFLSGNFGMGWGFVCGASRGRGVGCGTFA